MLKGLTQFLTRNQFLTRSNLIDLGIVVVIGIAIAVLIGGAFVALLTALIRDLLTPLIAAVIGKPDFSAIRFTVNGSMFLIGDFISAVVSFAVITATVYFFILVPASAILGRERRVQAALDHTTKQCPECLSTIAIQARRCAFCTSSVNLV
jgi:large conductance mechanosensitive channel